MGNRDQMSKEWNPNQSSEDNNEKTKSIQFERILSPSRNDGNDKMNNNYCGTTECNVTTCKCNAALKHVTQEKTSEDLVIMAQSLQGQYCMLTRIQRCMNKIEYDNKNYYDNVMGILKDIQKVCETTSKYNNKQSIMDSLAYPRRVTLDLTLADKDEDAATVSDTGTNSNITLQIRESRHHYPKLTDLNDAEMDLCPDFCPKCTNTMKLLWIEIDELRRMKNYLLKVRTEANIILEEVLTKALATIPANYSPFPPEVRNE